MVSFKKKIITLKALFISMAFMFIGNSLTLSSVGIMLKSQGQLIAGVISSFFYIGAIISTIFTKKFVGILGYKRSYIYVCLVFGISIFTQSFSKNLFFWLISRMVIGFCYYSLIIIIEGWLNSKAADSIRSRIISFYEVVYYGAFVIASVMLGFNLSSKIIFILSAMFVLIAIIPMFFINIKNPLVIKESKISLPSPFMIPPLALITVLSAGFMANGFLTMASAYVIMNSSVENVSVFMSMGLFGGFSSFFFISFISDKFGRKISIIIANFIALIATGIIVFFDVSFEYQKYLVFFVGFGIFCLYSLALARANDGAITRSKAIVLGSSVLFSYLLASVFSPIILGVIMQTFKGKSFFITYFLILLVLLIGVIFEQRFMKSSLYKKMHQTQTQAQ